MEKKADNVVRLGTLNIDSLAEGIGAEETAEEVMANMHRRELDVLVVTELGLFAKESGMKRMKKIVEERGGVIFFNSITRQAAQAILDKQVKGKKKKNKEKTKTRARGKGVAVIIGKALMDTSKVEKEEGGRAILVDTFINAEGIRKEEGNMTRKETKAWRKMTHVRLIAVYGITGGTRKLGGDKGKQNTDLGDWIKRKVSDARLKEMNVWLAGDLNSTMTEGEMDYMSLSDVRNNGWETSLARRMKDEMEGEDAFRDLHPGIPGHTMIGMNQSSRLDHVITWNNKFVYTKAVAVRDEWVVTHQHRLVVADICIKEAKEIFKERKRQVRGCVEMAQD